MTVNFKCYYTNLQIWFIFQMYYLSRLGYYPHSFSEEPGNCGSPIIAAPSMDVNRVNRVNELQNQQQYPQKTFHLPLVNLPLLLSEKWNEFQRVFDPPISHHLQNYLLQCYSDQRNMLITENNPPDFNCKPHFSLFYPQNLFLSVSNEADSFSFQKYPLFPTVNLKDPSDKCMHGGNNCYICRAEKNSRFVTQKQKTWKKRINDRSQSTVKRLLAELKSQSNDKQILNYQNIPTDFSWLRHQLEQKKVRIFFFFRK